MKFLQLSDKERRLHVAMMLGLSPGHPDSWPSEMIDRIIGHAERVAEITLKDDVRQAIRGLL